jgi:hypothetical protein
MELMGILPENEVNEFSDMDQDEIIKFKIEKDRLLYFINRFIARYITWSRHVNLLKWRRVTNTIGEDAQVVMSSEQGEVTLEEFSQSAEVGKLYNAWGNVKNSLAQPMKDKFEELLEEVRTNNVIDIN